MKNVNVPTPKPPRRFVPPAQEEENRDQWLDAIDPGQTRYSAPDKVVVFVLWVTKEHAEEWIRHMASYQRNEKTRSLRNFTDDMNEGYWINGIAEIAFDRFGDLINGQHVLKALKASKLEKVLCKVVINRWPDAYLGYDLGIRRNLGDNLKGETEHPTSVGKVLNVIRLWDRGVFKGKDGKGYMTAREGGGNLSGRRAQEYLKAHPGIEAHLFQNPFRFNKGVVSGAAICAISYRLHQVDPDLAPKFIAQLRKGELIKEGDPVFALRKRFIELNTETRWRSGMTLAPIIVAWNLFVNHEKCTVLPFRMGQPFPDIAVPIPMPSSSRASAKVH